MTLAEKIHFMLFSGKNSKLKYYAASYLRTYAPKWPLRRRLEHRLEKARLRPDYAYMEQRRDYYCRLSQGTDIGPDCPAIGDMRIEGQKVYFFDTYRYARHFDPALKLRLLPGDITYVPKVPSIVKSRPIGGDNANSTVMKLDRVRHFIFTDDRVPFREKADTALFRGKVKGKDNRIMFMERYYGHPMVDCGDVSRHNESHPEWLRPKLTLGQQLRHKFILAIEGNDVASNLKWIMSSNSVAVMPRPTYETWFMEGTLIPGYHYIEVAPDFSDLPERLAHYIAHPDEAEAIIAHANAYIDQFRDKTRESLISLMTLDKYFRATGQR